VKIASLILISAALLSGCKAAKDLSEKVEGIGGIEQPKERNYTASELTIGRRICSALKHKRELFETVTDMQEKFRFRGETKVCDNPNPFNMTEFTVAISNVSSTDFEYVATVNRANYFKDVVTDQTGAMKMLCDNLAKSDTVSNKMLSGSSYLTVNLLISEGYDRFDVLKSSKDSAGNYRLVSTETISVITQKAQADEKFFGVEKVRIRNTTCPNSKDFSSLKQTWVSALTSF
jgi:hypothetical protein